MEVVYLPGASASSAMVEVKVRSGAQTTLVRLAPTGFLKQKNLRLKEGDAVSITGYRVDAMEGDLLVATEVRKGTQTVTLRSDLGRSMW